jgi:hypothetical protein
MDPTTGRLLAQKTPATMVTNAKAPAIAIALIKVTSQYIGGISAVGPGISENLGGTIRKA